MHLLLQAGWNKAEVHRRFLDMHHLSIIFMMP